MIVGRSMHERWLSNAYVLGDAPGGTAVFVDSGAPLGPLARGRRARAADADAPPPDAHAPRPRRARGRALRRGSGSRSSPAISSPAASPCARLALPGHSDDGVAFVVNDEVCFSGDVLFKDAVGGGPADVVQRSVMDGLMTLPAGDPRPPGPHRRDDDRARVGEQPVRHLLARRRARRSGSRCASQATMPSSSSGRRTTTATARPSCASRDGREAIVGGSRVER